MGDMTESTESPGTRPEGLRIVTVGPDGSATEDSGLPMVADGSDDGTSLTDMVEQPAKVMRIGTMIKQLLEEVRAAPLDEASRARMREIHQSSIKELEAGLAPARRGKVEGGPLPLSQGTKPPRAGLGLPPGPPGGGGRGVCP